MNPLEHQELLAQIERLLSQDSDLGEDERARLIKRINASSETRKIYLQQCELEIAIRDAAQHGELAIRPKTNRLSHFRPLGIAALTLLGFFVVLQIIGPSVSAKAALARSLETLLEPVPRKYKMVIETTGSESGVRTIRNEIYMQGRDQFAMKFERPENDLWIGRKSSNDAWIVPPTGPVLHGNASSAFLWLYERRESLDLPEASNPNLPFLHLATALEAMMQQYDVDKLPDKIVPLEDGSMMNCQHFLGHRKEGEFSAMPDVMNLWTSSSLDIPIKLVLAWNAPTEPEKSQGQPQTRIELFYQGQPDPSTDWFSADSHYVGHREIKEIE